jgi:hypothetical protein
MRAASIGKRGGWLWTLCLLLLLGCGDPQPTPPVPPGPEKEDPIVKVQIPGAYGIPGGNQVYNEDRHQLSAMECPDGTLLFRILDPGERKVLSIHGIPASLKEGDRIAFHFRVMVNGYTIQAENFTDVLVLKLTGNMIWLKKDETTYFVLQR